MLHRLLRYLCFHFGSSGLQLRFDLFVPVCGKGSRAYADDTPTASHHDKSEQGGDADHLPATFLSFQGLHPPPEFGHERFVCLVGHRRIALRLGRWPRLNVVGHVQQSPR